MKAIVFGGTGFIGSHVVEQLHLAGHEVTVPVRASSDTGFLDGLGVRVVRIDFSKSDEIENAIRGHEVVYNCTADAKLHTNVTLEADVEVKLTRTLVEASAASGASRFVQLSTIVVYDFLSNDPMDETYISRPEYPIQRLGLERERIVQEVGRATGIETVIVRPASAIGVRDKTSFFSRFFAAHANNLYPLVGNGEGKVSLVDARDIGRAMVWLGSRPISRQDGGIYLLKGFDTTWAQLKQAIDDAVGRIAAPLVIPADVTDEQMAAYRMTPFTVKSLTVNRIWNDAKIRSLGFSTRYSLKETVDAAVQDLLARTASVASGR